MKTAAISNYDIISKSFCLVIIIIIIIITPAATTTK